MVSVPLGTLSEIQSLSLDLEGLFFERLDLTAHIVIGHARDLSHDLVIRQSKLTEVDFFSCLDLLDDFLA